jgi:hypothetical protein
MPSDENLRRLHPRATRPSSFFFASVVVCSVKS